MEASNSKLRPLDDTFNTANASLSDLRNCFIFVVSFLGLLRCDELIHTTRHNVSISPGHMTIFYPKWKNDQHLKSHTIFFSRSGKKNHVQFQSRTRSC